MSKLDQIKKPITAELDLYSDYIRKNIVSNTPAVSVVLEYLFSSRGKGIRPVMLFLSACMHSQGTPIGERSRLGAMIIEMTHTASLVHDDVVDEAYIRRGKPSVNALWQSRTAVLVGDFIFAQSYAVGLASGHFDVVAYVTGAMKEICEAELVQSEQSHTLSMTREVYNQIIYGKTATLIGTSSGVGALSVGASAEQVAKMREVGNNLGMAFQIKDDILDYSLEANTGKAVCNDLKERKITLPMLTVLETCDPAYKAKLISKLSNIRRRPANVEWLYKEVVARGGVEMATTVMYTYIDKAKELLGEYPPSPAKESMLLLCDYIAQRDK